MARQTKPLSVKEIESAKPKETDYVLYDGDGLELLIKSSGSKIWQFRYIRPVTKKRAKKSIGPYPSVTLADARSYRAEARALLKKQIDPQEHQQERLRSTLEAKTNTFKLVAERWWNVKKTSVTEDYAIDIWRSLERDVFPAIGDMSITTIASPEHRLTRFSARGRERRMVREPKPTTLYAPPPAIQDLHKTVVVK